MKEATPKAIRLQDYCVPDYLIDKTDLRIDLREDFTTVTATLAMRRNPESTSASAELVLEGADLDLQQIAIDDRPLAKNDYEVGEESLRIRQVPESFHLTTVCRIKPQENTTLEGLYKSRNMYCTQCEAEGFRHITYYLDRPDVMSEFTTTLIADKQRYPILLSNGNPVDRGDVEEGRHFVTWHDPFKKPAYLFAAVAGDLAVVEDSFRTCSGRDVQIKIYVEPKDLDKCDHALNSLKRSMKWDEEVYGREYDLDIFMIVAVDDFNMGAMENKGLNIFNTSCVLAKPEITTDAAFQRVEGVVAHEYFHNWSGNRVTCRDWFQLSLKEGFTVFRDAQFSADMGSPTVKRVEDVSLLRTMQFAEDAGPMAHPVQPSSYIEISNFYTLTIYEKGAEVVRMIYNLLGPTQFREGSDLYFERHDGCAVTINEFVKAMEDVSGRDLGQFKRWYTQAGTPRLSVTDHYDAVQQTYTLTIRQCSPETPDKQEKLPLHIPVKVGLIGSAGEMPLFMEGETEVPGTERVLELREPEQSFTFINITEKPVPSLLRAFSAPVRLDYNYSRDDLLTLMRHDGDGFSRWDASQSLGIRVIEDVMKAYPDAESAKVDPRLAEAYRDLLENTGLDAAMVALMLRLPSEAYLSEISDCVRPDAIHASRDRVREHLARELREQLTAVYERLNVDEEYEPSAEQIARRSLKNAALGYLSLLEGEEALARCVRQYQSANNMTDRLAALAAVINSEHPEANARARECLEDFYRQFKDEPLAIDQWLAVQATCQKSDALDRVYSLLKHPCFHLTNPNKVRSLIGAFCNQNLVNFHREDGAGYAFLGEQIRLLNSINPQMAARLLTPLTRWRKYDPARQELMKAELVRIRDLKDLSKDVYEVVSKSLAE
ncbi:aminopeptidase N [Proteobacteria bacterium 005FR1]|nr:aminopeptidase N [Proteobacteria bacterium 005FR1]